MIGKAVCMMHGGKSPSGIASGTFKNGHFSKVLPARLIERYGEARQDGEMLAMYEQIAVLDARIDDVLTRVDTGEAGALWQKAKQTWREFLKATATHDEAEIQQAGRVHGAALNEGLADWRAWDEVLKLIERRRRLVESERKRMLEAQQYIAVERALLFVHVILESIHKHVRDDDTLRAIQADFGRILGPADIRGPGSKSA